MFNHGILCCTLHVPSQAFFTPVHSPLPIPLFGEPDAPSLVAPPPLPAPFGGHSRVTITPGWSCATWHHAGVTDGHQRCEAPLKALKPVMILVQREGQDGRKRRP